MTEYPSMQCHEMFAEVMDHLVRDIRQIQNHASQYIFSKADDPREAFRDINAELSDYTAQTIDQLSALADQ